jgi:hypothetical protein
MLLRNSRPYITSDTLSHVVATSIPLTQHDMDIETFPKVADLKRRFESASLSVDIKGSIAGPTYREACRRPISPIPSSVRVIDLLPRFASTHDSRCPRPGGDSIRISMPAEARRGQTRASSASPPPACISDEEESQSGANTEQ